MIEQRLASASRHQDGKLVDLELYRRLRGAGVFNSPAIPEPRLRIDTATLSPQTAAKLIAHELSL